MIRVLLVDDDRKFGAECVRLLLESNYAVSFCENGERARMLLLDATFDIIVIDLMLPPTYGSEGLELLRLVRSQHPQLQPIMITVKQGNTTELVSDAMRIGARHFLDKNSELFPDRLIRSIKEVAMEKTNRIFISHGHNELLKLKLDRFLARRLHRDTLILSELPSKGLTVVEKLELGAEMCKCAVILITKDDEQRDGGLRARQNVIHEIGFFQGKYGREKVVLLAERGVELFSNISGIIRIEFECGTFDTVFESLRVEIEAAFGS